jgi:hypothetical protein
MEAMFDHGALTDLIIFTLGEQMALATDPNPPPYVGDGVAPNEGGWAEGQPGKGVFVPYVTVVSGGSAPRALGVNSHVPAWAVGFSLRGAGGSRKQVDWVGTTYRRALLGLKQQKFGSPPWKVINVEWVALGPVTRNDATSPASWGTSDTVTIVVDS